MKIISLLYPTVKCHGEAEQVLGKEVKGNGETKRFESLPVVEDGVVSNMPKQEKGVSYLVNAYVYNSLNKERDDLIMFDDKLANRDDKGEVISQGGVFMS